MKWWMLPILTLFLPIGVSAQVINEFLPHPSVGNPEWVEFYNASDSADYMKDYFLDDDLDFVNDLGSPKHKLSDLDISNITFPTVNLASFLNNGGDFVVLFNAEGIVIDQFQYTSDVGIDISLGRIPDGTGVFTSLPQNSKGVANSTPTPTSTPVPTSAPTSVPTATPTIVPTTMPTPTPKSSFNNFLKFRKPSLPNLLRIWVLHW